MAKGVINSISKIPPQLIWILAALGIAALLSSEDLQKKGQNLIKKMNELIADAITRIKEFIVTILEYLNKFIDLIEPISDPTFQFLGFLMVHFMDMQKELSSLDQKDFNVR